MEPTKQQGRGFASGPMHLAGAFAKCGFDSWRQWHPLTSANNNQALNRSLRSETIRIIREARV